MKTKTIYIDDKKPTLKELQEMVGGYIQIVYSNGKQIIMDEEGKLKDKPMNKEATELWVGEEQDDTVAAWDYDYIVGDAVVLSGKALLD